ncbi:RICIN domain-containing protein [Kitasatospora sp. NPDC057542]|uniref:RICIN domain-containing protein n=1 Tax=Streptomycetaceae TaxID=2062 RepID=UPI001CCCC7CE|nr:RICIN domain-containing protein [Streptomyces sp. LS1784]
MTIRLRLSFRAVALAVALVAAVAAVPLTATAARAATPICISGAIQYDYQSAEDGTAKPTRTKPLRYAVVELWGAEKSTDSPHALNVVGHTAADGSYNLCYTPTTTTSLSTVWVKAWASVSNLWWVADNSNQIYTMQLPALSNVTGNRNIGTAKPPASTSRAWHILDTIYLLWSNRNNPNSLCWSTNETNSQACTPLTVYWVDASGSAAYDPGSNSAFLYGADADSEHVILHEASHFLMHRMYNGLMPSGVNCQPHYVWYASSDGCAWSEGFATASAAYVLGDSRTVWGDGNSTNFTYGDGWGVGDVVEGNVAGSLLDLWRTVDTNWNASITAITAQKPMTFSAYFNTTRPAANPPLSTDSTALGKLNPHTIDYGPTIVGDGKYHSLTDGSGLALEVNGSCTAPSGSSTSLGTLDATRSWQRWRIDANADGTVRITDGCPQPLALTLPSPVNVGSTVIVKAYDPANSDQKWKVTKSNGTLRITHPMGSLALDRTSPAVGSAVVLNQYSSSNSQFWAPLS